MYLKQLLFAPNRRALVNQVFNSNKVISIPTYARQVNSTLLSSNSSHWIRYTSMGGYSTKPEETFIKDTIENHCVVVFSKTTCGYCRMAKRVFEEIGAPYQAVEINLRDDGGEIQEALTKITGATTVPRVFVNGSCVGGGTEVKKLHSQGKLLELIAKCQVNDKLHNISKL